MVEPLTLTASVIVNLACQKFLESGAGELGKKFTTEAIAAMDRLRKTLWERLRGKSDKLDQALAQAEAGDEKALATIAKNSESRLWLTVGEGFAEEIVSFGRTF